MNRVIQLKPDGCLETQFPATAESQALSMRNPSSELAARDSNRDLPRPQGAACGKGGFKPLPPSEMQATTKCTCNKTMKTLRVMLIGATLAVPSVLLAATNKGVEGSPHDFSTNSTYTVWNTRNGVCSPCHGAHNTDPAQVAPLWSHQTTTGPFTMYSSPTLLATMPSQPLGVALACLSCHDGTLGLNAPIGGLGTNTAHHAPDFVRIRLGAGGSRRRS
jgi:hypothetical protein